MEKDIPLHQVPWQWNTKTEARVPFLTFERGSSLDGRRLRLGGEAAWLNGPVAVLGEVINVSQEMIGPGGSIDTDILAWYVAFSWVLTGEKKTFKGVHPENPLVPGTEGSGSGALQLATRFSNLHLDEGLVDMGFVEADLHPKKVHSLDVGFNWYLTYNARTKIHFLRTEYSRPIVVNRDSRDAENALLLQFQLIF